MSNADPILVDRLVHEPARLLLLAHLAVVDTADFLFLMRQTGLTAGNVSSHMGKLEAARYVSVRKTFAGKRPRTVFKLTPAGRKALRQYHADMSALLESLPR
ncbi:MAG: transcriptional regulator [Planctomycetota bacterium]|jgi:DNA-binding MarR family transcriptional regulator